MNILKAVKGLVLLGAIVGLIACNKGEKEIVDNNFIEGRDYALLKTTMIVPQEAGSVRVDEFFWYACPHCYSFKQPFDSWLVKQSNVRVAKHAIPLGHEWFAMSKAYYAMMVVGGFDVFLDKAFFDTWHKERKNINKLDDMLKVVERVKGAQYAEKFKKEFDGEKVRQLVDKTKGMADGLGINSTPSVIVGGKYLVTSDVAKTSERMVKIIDFLVAKELKENSVIEQKK